MQRATKALPILAERVGDFFEFYDDDARTVCSAIGNVVTARGGRPMTGIPVHSAAEWIADIERTTGRKVKLPKT